jgi:CRP/FNR family transcriptional regulator
MSLDAIPGPTGTYDQPANSVALGELAGLLHAPLPKQARLAAARVGLHRPASRAVLFRSGDRFESFYVVLSGMLKLTAVDGGGREQVFAFVVPGEAAGLDGFEDGRHRLDATALGAVEVASVPLTQLQRAAQLAGEHELGDQLVRRILTQGMVKDVGMVCLLETLDPRSRVAAFLLSLLTRLGRVRSEAVPVELSMTDREIGSYLRLSPASIGAVLRDFAEAGLVRLNGRRVSLASGSGLAALVDEGRWSRGCHTAGLQ